MSGSTEPCLNRLLTMDTANSAYPEGVVPAGEGSGGPMSINDLPVLSALRTKMQWHQERQRVLAENVSNSDTPNFKPRDLVEPKFEKPGAAAAGGAMGTLPMLRTQGVTITPSSSAASFGANSRGSYETRPA